MRKDVYKLAEKLNVECGIDVDALYAWLMMVGKDKGENPRLMQFGTRTGLVFLEGEHNNYRLEMFNAAKSQYTNYAMADAYENAILERQEQYID